MEKKFKVAIIGGGASGLICAIELLRGNTALNGKDIAIFERMNRVGKKLIATGNGQGNLTNANFNEKYYHGDLRFIKDFIQIANDVDIEKYLFGLGISLIQDENGKKYPLSKQASAVLDIFRAHLLYGGVNEITGCFIDRIEKTVNGYYLYSGKEKYFAENVVMAFGGKAGKQFGTDGESYQLATSLNHKLTKLYPSLVQIKTDMTFIRGLKGIKEFAKVYALDGERELATAYGDVLFTEYGVSGNAVFTISGYLITAENPKIKIEFLPYYSVDKITELISNCKSKNLNLGALCGIVNKRVGYVIEKYSKSSSDKDLAFALKNFTLKVSGSLGFNYAQVTKGGIDTADVELPSFKSKLSENVYIVGEALNVDGDCGGYNLTFAFVSGISCAVAIKKSING